MNESEQAPEQALATRTLRGMAWAYGAFGGGRAVVLVSTAILARLLTPREFGVVALALVFMTFLESLNELGLGQALIVAAVDEEAERAQTVFSWSVVLGLALTIAMAACSSPIAGFFHQPQLADLLPVLGFNFFLRALGATHYALARKQLNYRVRTVSEISEVVVRGGVSIGLALAGAGVWSLVIGFVAGVLASTTALWLQVDFRPRLALTRTHLRDMVQFGGALTLVDVGSVIIANTDYLFIGRILGASSLGLYSIGFRIPELAILNVAHVAADVLFPAYSALDPQRLRDGYLKSLRYLTMLTMPLAAGVVALARPMILVVFGHQWTGSIPVARAIAGYTLFATLSIPPGTVLKVTRRIPLMIAFAIPLLLALIGLLVIFTNQGIVAVALATSVLQTTVAPLQIFIVSRQLKLSPLSSVRVMTPPLIAAAVMAGALIALQQVIGPPVLELIVGIPLGGAIYLAVLWSMSREELIALRTMAFPRSSS